MNGDYFPSAEVHFALESSDPNFDWPETSEEAEDRRIAERWEAERAAQTTTPEMTERRAA